jgi:hypothetical protein
MHSFLPLPPLVVNGWWQTRGYYPFPQRPLIALLMVCHCLSQEDLWRGICAHIDAACGSHVPRDLVVGHFARQVVLPRVLDREALAEALAGLGFAEAGLQAHVADLDTLQRVVTEVRPHPSFPLAMRRH